MNALEGGISYTFILQQVYYCLVDKMEEVTSYGSKSSFGENGLWDIIHVSLLSNRETLEEIEKIEKAIKCVLKQKMEESCHLGY